MDLTSIALDWNQIRAFLITAEEGSFSAAARTFNTSQPTLSRQVRALEQDLNVTLFERVGRNLSLTPSGHELLEHVRTMGEAANRLSLAASGKSKNIEGRVCISTTDLVATYLLPDALRKIRTQYPDIEIEILASNSLSDLQRREADIAIRHTRPQQGELIAKLIRESSIGLYAAQSYLHQYGTPEQLSDLADTDFIGFHRSENVLPYLSKYDLPLTAKNFRLGSQNGMFTWEMVKQGLGIGLMITDIGERTNGVTRILPDLQLENIPFWLVTHRELQTSQRIRAVFDLLSEVLTEPKKS